MQDLLMGEGWNFIETSMHLHYIQALTLYVDEKEGQSTSCT